MGEILVYQDNTGRESEPDPLTILDSYHPGSGKLTYYYWDDWMLSGLLFPEGETLTLGIAGASGPRQLAQVDPLHRQVGVDLVPPSGDAAPMEFHLGSATDYISKSERSFDSIWIDLYRSALPEFGIFDADFLSSLKKRLKPKGLAFIHLFRPANCFYRYGRDYDAFEPLLAGHLAKFGFSISVLDHYSSQTWIIGDASRFDLSMPSHSSNDLLRRWIPYARAIKRTIPTDEGTTSEASTETLESTFVRPVPSSLIKRLGFDFCDDAGEWEAKLSNPTELARHHRRLASSQAGVILMETLALWVTAPGARLPLETRRYLATFAASHPATTSPEFELRRPLFA